MTGKITVKRYEHKERTRKLPNGQVVVAAPASNESYYYWNGKEIAHYRSRDDRIGLNSDYLSRDTKASYMDRMKKSKYPEMWADLVEFLNVDENTRLTEYFNV